MIPGQQQQQQQHSGQGQLPQVQVLPPGTVLQQPIVIDPRRRGTPFILRGAKFQNGCKCPGGCFIFMVTFGTVQTFVGFTLLISLMDRSPSIGLSFFMLGIVLLVSGTYCCCLARCQYNALPPNHPDRTKYGTGFVIPSNAATNTITTYALPPGEQITGFPVASAGYPLAFSDQPVAYPPQQDSVLGQPVAYAGYPAPPVGHPMLAEGPIAPGYQPSAPAGDLFANDLPPPYSEVVKETQYKQYDMV